MKRGLLLVAFVCCFLVLPSSVLACSCALPTGSVRQQVEKARKDSRAIFSGTVIEVTPVVPYRLGVGFSVKFRVDRSWKGRISEEIAIFTGSGGGDCGLSFDIGDRYLVYAFGTSDASLSTGICQRTRPIGAGAGDIKILGPGKVVQKPKT